jgi:hypothetical protein
MRSTHRARSLSFSLCLLVAATLSTVLPVRAQAPQWKPFSSPTDGFRAQFPVDPEVSKNSVPVGNDSFELRSYEADAGSTALYVGVCDYGAKGAAADPEEMLASAKKGAVDHMAAHILTEKKITLGSGTGSAPGVEFQAESDKLHFTARMYVAAGVLYQTMVATPLSEKFADTARFLDSFELLPTNRPAPAPAPIADWKQYRYADDGFSASFPAAPALEKQTITTEAGPVELRTYVVENATGALITAVCDYGPTAAGKDPDDLLENAKKGAVSNIKGQLTSEKRIVLGSYHGVEFEADGESAHVSVRVYLVGTTLYQMIVASPGKAPSPETARFLDSFELIPHRPAD